MQVIIAMDTGAPACGPAALGAASALAPPIGTILPAMLNQIFDDLVTGS